MNVPDRQSAGFENLRDMLSKKCQYALHALLYITEKEKSDLVTIHEIAEKKNIPRKFLEAILVDLKSGGIVDSKKGKFGGYYLNRKPEDVNILEVIRLIDGAVAMLPCVSLNFYESCGRCEDEKTCNINKLFSAVRDETLKILSGTTLADLQNQSFARILRTKAVPSRRGARSVKPV